MDRREALKLLTGGAALVVGATAIESSTAFADGGTLAFRPTCGTASSVLTWSSVSTNNRIDVTITVGTTTCLAGWTASRQISFSVTNSSIYNGTTGAATDVTGTFTTIGTGATVWQIRSTGGGDLPNTNPSIGATIVIRRVCTNNTNSTRKAYCCTRYVKTAATYTRGGTDQWGGATTGNFGTGTTPVTAGNGCTAP